MKLKKILAITLVTILSLCNVYAVSAASRALVLNSGIIFIDLCGSSAGSTAMTRVAGGTNEEIVWNFLISKGLTPVAAAGVMGNLEQESSSFDPWAGENGNTSIDKNLQGVGFGIVQWTNTAGSPRRANVMTHLENNGIPLNATDESMVHAALVAELDWLWSGEYGSETWQAPLNAETTVDGDPSRPYQSDNTGNGSTLLFHALVERSGDGTAGKQERIDSAKKYLEKFAGGGEGMGTINVTINVSGGGELGAICRNWGGTTVGNSSWQDASSLADAFMGSVGPRGSYSAQGRTYHRCTNGCTVMPLWFINEYTTLTYGGGNGNQVVDNLASANGLQVVDYPTAPAIFSSFAGNWDATGGEGHVGVVVAVDGDTATAVHIWGANYCSDYPQISTFTIPHDTSRVRFVNVGDYLK